MDVLSNKTKKECDYLSRYSTFPIYYHKTDNRYTTGITNQLDSNIPYILATVDPYTSLDFLANKYYGRPDYYWIIADFNHITDVFIDLYPTYKQIKIPSINGLKYKE